MSPGFATGETVLVVPDMSPGAHGGRCPSCTPRARSNGLARTRRWNFGVSLGVLALLAASVALALVASQRAQRLARERMEFVAGISHELRTPSSVIRSAAENLADGVVDAGPKVQQYGTLIADEGRKLSDMVDQVLTFSTLESGHALRLQPAAVDEIVGDVVRGLAPMAEAAGMRIETRVEGPVPPVMADAAALGRVVANLVTNAVKYAASGRGSAWSSTWIRRPTGSAWRWPTAGPASRTRTRSGSSNRSSAARMPSPRRSTATASASISCAASPRSTADGCRWTANPAAGARSASSCRRWRPSAGVGADRVHPPARASMKPAPTYVE